MESIPFVNATCVCVHVQYQAALWLCVVGMGSTYLIQDLEWCVTEEEATRAAIEWRWCHQALVNASTALHLRDTALPSCTNQRYLPNFKPVAQWCQQLALRCSAWGSEWQAGCRLRTCVFGSLASEVQWYCMRGLRPTSPSTSTATLRCPFGGRLLQHMTLTRKAAVTSAAAPHKLAHTNEHMEGSDLVWFGFVAGR